jgi:hypothetical protein
MEVNDHGQDYDFSVDKNVHINNPTSPLLRFELRLVWGNTKACARFNCVWAYLSQEARVVSTEARYVVRGLDSERSGLQIVGRLPQVYYFFLCRILLFRISQLRRKCLACTEAIAWHSPQIWALHDIIPIFWYPIAIPKYGIPGHMPQIWLSPDTIYNFWHPMT